jgi:hypothetical protein
MSYHWNGLHELSPVISTKDEDTILNAIIGPPPPPESFLSQNKIPIFVGGSVLFLSMLGLILLLNA